MFILVSCFNYSLRIGVLIRLAVGVTWTPLNQTDQAEQRKLLRKGTDALKKIAPDTGAYVNEVSSRLDKTYNTCNR
jgi:hypothetical protein